MSRQNQTSRRIRGRRRSRALRLLLDSCQRPSTTLTTMLVASTVLALAIALPGHPLCNRGSGTHMSAAATSLPVPEPVYTVPGFSAENAAAISAARAAGPCVTATEARLHSAPSIIASMSVPCAAAFALAANHYALMLQ